MKTLRSLRAWWRRINDPVCQDPQAVLYTTHRGVLVPMRPVYDRRVPTRIAEWVADPTYADLAERRIHDALPPAAGTPVPGPAQAATSAVPASPVLDIGTLP